MVSLLINDSIERRPALLYLELANLNEFTNLRLRSYNIPEDSKLKVKLVDTDSCGMWGLHETLVFFFKGDEQTITDMFECMDWETNQNNISNFMYYHYSEFKTKALLKSQLLLK